MSAPHRISFAGFDPSSARASGITVDLDALGERLDDLEGIRKARSFAPKEEGLYRRPPPEESPEDPEIGRWAAVVLKEDIDRAREALAPLLALRASQGVAFTCRGMSGEPGLLAVDRPASASPDRWLRNLREAAAGPPPYYLLLAGGPRSFPFEIQAALEMDFAVGRIDAGEAEGGALHWEAVHAWAEKLVRYEEGRMPVDPGALLYSFATDDPTRRSHEELALPLAAKLADPRLLFGRDATTAGLCEALATSRPALVITASHGLESFDAPDGREGWGALTDEGFAGKMGTPLDAARVRACPSFAPGAVMVSFACFSAGVPAESVHRALTEQADGTIAGGPFTSALPQALLAHPEGPVAFVGHVDRATSESFQPRGPAKGPTAFLDFASWWLGKANGTLGQAMSGFRDARGSAARALADVLGRARKKPALAATKATVDAWVRYHDADGYVLLGDPVTRRRAVR